MPEVSIIVCTYNREKYIGQTLSHLNDQTSNFENYEVIVIDNNSTDNTEAICKDFIFNHPSLDIRYFKEFNQGHTFARNRGIKESAARLLAFIDDDAFVNRDYVDNTISFFESHPNVQVIGGKIIPEYEGKPPKWMTSYLLPLVSAIDMGNTIKPFKGSKFPIGANMIYRSHVFEKYGLFDVNLGRRGDGLEGGDEKELILRLKKKDESIYYAPNIVVRHIIPEKRLTENYIKGLADGVAKSELKRLKNQSFWSKSKKVFDELVKIGGTVFLAILYYCKFSSPQANMLIKFRYWVVKGYFS